MRREAPLPPPPRFISKSKSGGAEGSHGAPQALHRATGPVRGPRRQIITSVDFQKQEASVFTSSESTAEPGGARRSPAEPGGARRSPAEPGGARRSPTEPSGAQRSPAEPSGAQRSPTEPSGDRRSTTEPRGFGST
ncbi:acidic proline-rich protein PRP25-like [Poecilia reticulata]|uniref:acidic proline-rich protein PRP25-like n=1 Tax=Poecilia reticulata TaxID=8081 RepID=UPI0007EB7165|nr:PREDICTED: acidic proline-rich protein PRP25-like [Poecilia reticulata]